MKRIIFLLFTLYFLVPVTAQETNNNKSKLVVGIVVDQMRYDYLTRFWDRYGNGGFKKMINGGYNFRNNHFNYMPTYTGPGHASVFTGTSPMNHGIIGNNWYNKFEGKMVYCVEDSSTTSVGTSSSAGQMSPHRLNATTVADENRLHTEFRGKTIGVALKDRASILPAGHTANAAYWFNGGKEGHWITSSYYTKELPQWVKNFNKSGKADFYLKDWNTLYPITTYSESGVDLNNFEGGFTGKKTASFPYNLAELKDENGGFDILKAVPYGNDLTLDFALAAIEGEELGKDEDTDFLTLSFSSTDYVGHNFGVNSKELEDTYLRLDKTLEKLLDYLDQNIGKGSYTIFLTADHGGVDVPAYLESVNAPGGYFNSRSFEQTVEEFVEKEFGRADLIENISNNQVFFNYEALEKAQIAAEELELKLAHEILQLKQIDKVFTRTQMQQGSFTKGLAADIQNGFNQKRSGDVIYVLDPAVISYSKTGSTHGTGFSYDTHVPLIFYGNGIAHGSTVKRSEIIDIAPTVAALLGISFPNSSTGQPLYIMLDQELAE
ncbi:alkaline phosphatase PafA [Zunongwangia sp. H14]|uniref:alkaline phosphatase PafA n=1 Tax=Zunongwangia sp. H14 TaxID=3240792 RepID=UPI0035626ED5